MKLRISGFYSTCIAKVSLSPARCSHNFIPLLHIVHKFMKSKQHAPPPSTTPIWHQTNTMKLTLLLPLLAVSFETTHAKDVFRGKNGGRSRALQDEFSLPSDISVAGIESEPARLDSKSSASDICPGVIRSGSKSGKSAKNGDEYCLDENCGTCVGLITLFEEKGCYDLVTKNPLDECYTLPALEELALDQIPKCALLLLYGLLGGCVGGPVCDPECYGDAFTSVMGQYAIDSAESESASAGGTLFGLKLDELSAIIRANLPADFAF
jgi:hypothetical protein